MMTLSQLLILSSTDSPSSALLTSFFSKLPPLTLPTDSPSNALQIPDISSSSLTVLRDSSSLRIRLQSDHLRNNGLATCVNATKCCKSKPNKSAWTMSSSIDLNWSNSACSRRLSSNSSTPTPQACLTTILLRTTHGFRSSLHLGWIW